MSVRNQYILLGSFGGWNSGDEAILESVEALLRFPPRETDDGEVVVICHRIRDGYVQRYASESRHAVAAKDLRAITSYLRKRQLVIGGGQIITGDRTYKGLLFLLLLTTFARTLGRPAVMVGIGVEGVHRRAAKWLCRRIVANCEFVHCRDEYSRSMLVDAGCRPDRLGLSADVVLSGLITKSFPTPARGVIAIGLHHTPLRTYTDDDEIRQLAFGIADAFVDDDVVLVSNDCRDGFDQSMLEHLRETIDHPRIHFQAFDNVWGIIETYATARCVISVRMHPLILALIHRVPVIGFARSNKVKQLAARVGFDLVDPATDGVGEIVQRLRMAMQSDVPSTAELASMAKEAFVPLVTSQPKFKA